jgi:hypothetical protein
MAERPLAQVFLTLAERDRVAYRKLALPADQRGKDLTADDTRALGARIEACAVLRAHASAA